MKIELYVNGEKVGAQPFPGLSNIDLLLKYSVHAIRLVPNPAYFARTDHIMVKIDNEFPRRTRDYNNMRGITGQDLYVDALFDTTKGRVG